LAKAYLLFAQQQNIERVAEKKNDVLACSASFCESVKFFKLLSHRRQIF